MIKAALKISHRDIILITQRPLGHNNLNEKKLDSIQLNCSLDTVFLNLIQSAQNAFLNDWVECFIRVSDVVFVHFYLILKNFPLISLFLLMKSVITCQTELVTLETTCVEAPKLIKP